MLPSVYAVAARRGEMTARAAALHPHRIRGTLCAYFGEWRGMLIDEESVSATLDAVNAALFEARELPVTERRRVACWLVARQGLSGAYANTFAGFDRERRSGILTFTGERITSASARHILGEETCRTLRLWASATPRLSAPSSLADRNLLDRLEGKRQGPLHDNPGFFCCCKCSIGLWRNLLVGGLDRQPERLKHGVRELARGAMESSAGRGFRSGIRRLRSTRWTTLKRGPN